jgi:two-component system chemotaxis response regulator CheB
VIPAPSPVHPAAHGEPVRVLICDDSAVIRGAITRMLEADPAITVAGRAANGRAAVEESARLSPDVVVLDIEMPVMDGLAALAELHRADPSMRVIMASTLTTRGADIALRALRLGAADYVPKPSALNVASDAGFAQELREKVKGQGRLRQRSRARPPAVPSPAAPAVGLRPPPARRPVLLAVGSSTGGPQALFTLVQGLGPRLPVPGVITQHMPPLFTSILAEHITRLGAAPCAEARDGEPLQAGRLYLAPGDRHLTVGQRGGRLVAQLADTPAENFCRPSVDPMLRSAAAACDGRVLTVMLTGMGHDGLAGTRAVVSAGGTAIAQDEASSVVWGMPGAIAQAGLCHAVLPLPRIAARVSELLQGGLT